MYWIAAWIMASDFKVNRYTLALYWISQYGAKEEDLREINQLRMANKQMNSDPHQRG